RPAAYSANGVLHARSAIPYGSQTLAGSGNGAAVRNFACADAGAGRGKARRAERDVRIAAGSWTPLQLPGADRETLRCLFPGDEDRAAAGRAVAGTRSGVLRRMDRGRGCGLHAARA